MVDDRFLTTKEVAAIVKLSPRTLDRYRVYGKGPPFYKFGNRVRYKVVDVESWAAKRQDKPELR